MPVRPVRKAPTARLATVVRTHQLTPHMVRVVLTGEELTGLPTGEYTDYYVKLLFPAEGVEYPAPFDMARIREEYPRDQWPTMRTYTIRRWVTWSSDGGADGATEVKRLDVRIEWTEKAKARGFSYTTEETTTTGSMTTAGLAGLMICQRELWRSRRFTGELRETTRVAIRDGLAWMQTHFRRRRLRDRHVRAGAFRCAKRERTPRNAAKTSAAGRRNTCAEYQRRSVSAPSV